MLRSSKTKLFSGNNQHIPRLPLLLTGRRLACTRSAPLSTHEPFALWPKSAQWGGIWHVLYPIIPHMHMPRRRLAARPDPRRGIEAGGAVPRAARGHARGAAAAGRRQRKRRRRGRRPALRLPGRRADRGSVREGRRRRARAVGFHGFGPGRRPRRRAAREPSGLLRAVYRRSILAQLRPLTRTDPI